MTALYWWQYAYRSSTGLIGLFLLWSAGSYLFSTAAIDGLRELGFPEFFRWQLLALKLLALPALLAPGVPMMVRDWAYAGVALFLITALVAHTAHGDPWAFSLLLVALALVLGLSRWSLSQLS